jgi:hypothetical protein
MDPRSAPDGEPVRASAERMVIALSGLVIAADRCGGKPLPGAWTKSSTRHKIGLIQVRLYDRRRPDNPLDQGRKHGID